MFQNKFPKWLLIFLITIALLPLLHLFDSFTTPRKVEDLSADIEISIINSELSLSISQLISNAQAYMLYSDRQYLDDFYRFSNETIKKELSLLNKVDSIEKEKIETLLKVNKSYVSFVEEEIIPAVHAGNPGNYSHDLQSKHQALSSELMNKANSLHIVSQKQLSEDSRALVSLERKKRTFSFILMAASLIIFTAGTVKFLVPVLAHFTRLDQLASRVKSAAVIIDKKGYVININPAAEKLLSVTADLIREKTLNEIVNLFPYTQNIFQPLFAAILETKEINDYQTFYTCNGSKTLLTADYFPLIIKNNIIGAALIARPVQIHQDKQYLFEAIEAERKKISIEIHDWIGRNMSPIIHAVDYILNLDNDKTPISVQEQLVKLRKHCQSAANDMRSIMNDIHPYLIDKVGLIPALESYVRNFEQTSGIKVYLFYQDRPFNLEKTTEIIIYRIIQEALTNVAKHSNAGEVDIYFTQNDDNLKIEILDDGNNNNTTGDGKGLWGMKERANLVGGDLIYGFTDNGFAVTLTIPISTEGPISGEQ